MLWIFGNFEIYVRGTLCILRVYVNVCNKYKYIYKITYKYFLLEKPPSKQQLKRKRKKQAEQEQAGKSEQQVKPDGQHLIAEPSVCQSPVTALQV